MRINKNIFTKLILEKSYENYLAKLSKEGSRDDISIIFVNILFGGVTIVAGIRSFQSETGPYA